MLATPSAPANLVAKAACHGEGHSMAWFTDPAGNGLSVVKLAAMP